LTLSNVSECRAKKQGTRTSSSGDRTRVLGAFAIQTTPAAEQQRQLLWIGAIDIPEHYRLKSVWLPAESPTFVGSQSSVLSSRLLLMLMTTKVGCAPVTIHLTCPEPLCPQLSVVITPQTYVSPRLKSHMSLDTDVDTDVDVDVATHASHGSGITYSCGHINTYFWSQAGLGKFENVRESK